MIQRMAAGTREDFSIGFWSGSLLEEHMHQDVELLFVLDGILTVTMLDTRFELKAEDILVINSNHRHRLIAAEPVYVCVLHFNYSMLLSGQDRKLPFFYCNSAVQKGEKYDGLREIMGNLLSECAVNADKMTFIKKSQMYRLLHYLVQYFMSDGIPDNSRSDDARVERILQYIHANYNQTLTLAEMAELMYMAPSSFSRFFKKHVGMTFVEYVNHVRLHFALEDVRYTDKSVAWIAQAHGFANSSAFCRAFKEAYHMAPMQYRRQAPDVQQPKKTSGQEKALLQKYLRENDMHVWHPWKKKTAEISADARVFMPFENIWGKALNLGAAPMLLSAVLQKQIVFARKMLGFSCGRITGLFSAKMNLRPGHEPHILNYDSLDVIFDFLVENEIQPLICLDNKPTAILKSANEELSEGNSELIFETIEECLGVLDDFLHHVISRYGHDAADHWMFECWYDEFFENTMGIRGSFPGIFTRLYRCIRARLENAAIGGCGLSTAISAEKFDRMIDAWSLEPVRPDFISIYLLPYVRADIDGRRHARRRPNMDFGAEDLEQSRQILDAKGWSGVPVYVPEWNLSLSQRNYFNDCCGKAALMAQQMCSLTGRLSFAAYGALSDLSGSYYDSGRLLIGAGGLMCRSGICKPAFYAVRFMNMLDAYLVSRSKHGMVTADGRGAYSILCFNHKKLKYNYYIRDEYDIDPDMVKTIFEDEDRLDITVTIDHVPDGRYMIREYGIWPERGSVLTEWEALGRSAPVSLENINYLKNICVPCQKNGSITVSQGKLVLLKTLEAHELLLIKIEPD